MSTSLKLLAAAALLVGVAGCAQTDDVEEFVVADPGPVTVEPTFTGKYN